MTSTSESSAIKRKREEDELNFKSEVAVRYKEKSCPRRWTDLEDNLLRKAVETKGEKNWKDIATHVQGRNHTQCLQRWTKVLKPGLVKGHWTKNEDDILIGMVKHGRKTWGQIANQINGRTYVCFIRFLKSVDTIATIRSKQCRERWCNHLDPQINKGAYTAEEDAVILDLQKELGNRWSYIANRLPGRTEDAVKIRWKSLMRSKVPKNGKRVKTSRPSMTLVGEKLNGSFQQFHQQNVPHVERVLGELPVSTSILRNGSTLQTPREEWGTQTPRTEERIKTGFTKELISQERLKLMVLEGSHDSSSMLRTATLESPGSALIAKQLQENQMRQAQDTPSNWKAAVEHITSPRTTTDPNSFIHQIQHFDGFLDKITSMQKQNARVL